MDQMEEEREAKKVRSNDVGNSGSSSSSREERLSVNENNK